MKARVLWILLLLGATAPLAAGDVYYSDSNAAAGGLSSIPWTSAQVRYQTLVPATVLGSKKFFITDLAFATGAVSTFTATHCEITFAHLPTPGRLSTVFASNLTKDATVVFSGPITWPCRLDQWCPLGLKGTFGYNGVDQIVIQVRYYGGAGGVTTRSGLVTKVAISGGGAYKATNAGPLLTKGAPKVRLTYSETALALSGSPSPGGVIDLDLLSTVDAGLGYQLGCSLGLGPIPIDSRKLGLSADAMLQLSVSGSLPAVFRSFAGVLDTKGKAKAKISIPAVAALKGVRIHTAFLTLRSTAPSGVAHISNTATFTIR